MKDEKELIFRNETYQIIGAAMEVHKILGPGFLEAVYHEAMEIEFIARSIPFESHKKLKIPYKSHILKQPYEADFLVFNEIIVEIKALEALITKHHAQILNYLKATEKKVGLLMNFGEMSLVNKRFIL
jgi:GxxExxY protein